MLEGAQGLPPPIHPQPNGVSPPAPQNGAPAVQGQIGQQPVVPAPPNHQLAQQVQPQRPRANGHNPPPVLQARRMGPTAQDLAKGLVPSSKDLIDQIGSKPSKLIGQSTHYKAVIKELDLVRTAIDTANFAPTGPDRANQTLLGRDIEKVEVMLKNLDHELERYGEGRKTGHKDEMANLRVGVQSLLGQIDRLKTEMANGAPWPVGLSLRSALTYLRANPALTLQELGVAYRHGLSEGLVKSYTDAKVPLREGTMPGGARLNGELTLLGEGGTASVFKGTFQMPGGTLLDGVFKSAEARPLEKGEYGIGVDPKAPNFVGRSVATYRLDEHLQFGLVPRTEMVVHDGKVGTVMGMAQGHSPLMSGNWTCKLPASEVNRLKNDPQALQNLIAVNHWKGAVFEGNLLKVEMPSSRDDTAVLFDMRDPELRMQLTRLQWLDALCGQVDRHAHNYFVHIGPDNKPKVTAIDNDMAFGKAILKGDDVCSKPYRGNSFADGNAFNGAMLPKVVDQTTYTALMSLRPDQLDGLLGDLLTPEEVDAAKSRLTDIQTELGKLQQGGQVLQNVDDWALPSTSQHLGVPDMQTMLTDLRNTGKPFHKGEPVVQQYLGNASDSSYVAREATMLQMCLTQPYKPFILPQLVK